MEPLIKPVAVVAGSVIWILVNMLVTKKMCSFHKRGYADGGEEYGGDLLGS